MPNPQAILCAATLLAAPAGGDPRLPLIELQIAGETRKALQLTEELVGARGDAEGDLWLLYLQGDLLERLGRLQEANNVFGRLLSAEDDLAAYGRYRMASLQEALGHPEVAAGLVATLLGHEAPPALVPRATELLVRSLAKGADCRLLGRLDDWSVPDEQRRALRLAEAECALRERRDPARAAEVLADLLGQETADSVGRQAAELLAREDDGSALGPEVQIAIGLAFHHNREFERAAEYLERGLAALDPENLAISPRALSEYRYATARAYFWLGDYDAAVRGFTELAATERGEPAARALYQAARCHELSGNWRDAAATFRRAFLADRDGSWAAAALFSALRLEFRGGREADALELFAVLDSRPAWTDMARRAALFLSASDVERGRTDRPASWLRRDPGNEAIPEFLYWTARLAELEASPHLAIRNYVEILERSPYHPLAGAAVARLRGPALAPLLEPIAQQLAASGRRGDLHAAWILLGDGSPGGAAARGRLEELLRLDRRARAFLDLREVPPAEWPLLRAPLTRPEERFLALGLWADGEAQLGRHFPFQQPALAFSAGLRLADAGLTRRGLYVAEVLAEAIPPWLPEALLPTEYRRLLYPLPHRATIERSAAQRGIDSHLLAAVIREESRFDPRAVSVAAARGLTQFVYPTALEVAPTVGVELEDPSQLHQPAIAIALGAGYLAQLTERFAGRTEIAVAAYNAGADQARLWRSYCYSRNPAEFYSKVGFAQTRNYLRKVLSSRSQYAELYGARPSFSGLTPAGS